MSLMEILKKSRIEPYFFEDDFALVLGDSVGILERLPENIFDLIFSDPPYKLSNGGFTVHSGRRAPVDKGEWDKSKGFDEDVKFHESWLKECKRILSDNGTIWVSGTYHSIYICGFLMQKLGFKILNEIVWFKPNASPNISCRYFTASHETIIWAKKSEKAKHKFNYDFVKNFSDPEDLLKKTGKQMRSVWSMPAPLNRKKIFADTSSTSISKTS